MTEKIPTNYKAPTFKVNDRVRITKYKNNIREGFAENWSRETFIINFVLKTNPCIYKVKDLNKEKIIGSFFKKELLLSML